MIFLDWNPTIEFWYYEKVANRNDVDHIIVTYKDNEGLDKAIVDSIEQHKNDKQWWLVYGLGQLGEVETRIYKGWQIIDEIPYGAELKRYGLDFGYTNDPTAIVALYYHDGGYILDEVLYQKGMLNKQIADTINVQEQKALTIADSSEPKSIDEIRLHGVNILAAIKGIGSVTKGIQLVQGKKVSMTKRSINLIREYRNYVWITDDDGKILNEPVDINNHAMDALRYAFNSLSVGNNMAKSFVPNHVGGARRGYFEPK
jgi:phage terminase large subunit